MCVSDILLKFVSPKPNLNKLNRFLFIGPHPDDIEIGAGCTAARLSSAGKEVYFCIVTDGSCGTEKDDVTRAELKAVREAEARSSASAIGAKDVFFLEFPDGGFYSDCDVEKSLLKIISEVKPDIIFAPDPNLVTECHPDHLKTASAACRAFLFCTNKIICKENGITPSPAPKGLLLYYTANPDFYYATKGFEKVQLEALKHHMSQFEYTDDGKGSLNRILLYFGFRRLRFGLKSFKGSAEGFRLLTALTAHCYAEKKY